MKPASDERTPDGTAPFAGQPDREQLMTTAITDRTDAIIIRVGGEVDGLTAPRLATVITSAFDRLAGRRLVVDLSAIDFLGSTGLLALQDGAAEAVRNQVPHQLRIVVNRNRPALRPIEIAGLDLLLELFDTVEDAVASGDLH